MCREIREQWVGNQVVVMSDLIMTTTECHLDEVRLDLLGVIQLPLEGHTQDEGELRFGDG